VRITRKRKIFDGGQVFDVIIGNDEFMQDASVVLDTGHYVPVVLWSQGESYPAESSCILCFLVLEELLLELKGKIFHVVMNHHQLLLALEVEQSIAHLLLAQLALLDLLSGFFLNHRNFIQPGY
jgi:hypothetical protein